jgi:hypothetical protein
MTPMPELGWAGTVGIIGTIVSLVVALVVYHGWLDRRRTPSDEAGRASLDPAAHRAERRPRPS